MRGLPDNGHVVVVTATGRAGGATCDTENISLIFYPDCSVPVPDNGHVVVSATGRAGGATWDLRTAKYRVPVPKYQ